MSRLPLKWSLVALAVLAVVAAAAWASWTVVGSGTGEAKVGTLNAPVVSVDPASAGSHTVSWTAATLSDPLPEATEITYTVERKLTGGPGDFAPVGGTGGCAGAFDSATFSCTDTVSASGTYVYRVVAEFRSWTATSNEDSIIVVIVPAGDITAPTVSSIVRANPSPTNAASVDFTVTFSENVTGVDTADFTLAATGVSGASVASVTPSTGPEDVYTVSVNTGAGSGTLGLNLVDNDTIKDGANNPLGGITPGNGNFTGETYAIDKTSPTVLTINRAEGEITNAATLTWTVTFSEGVEEVTTDDFALVQTGGVATAAITGVTPVAGPSTTYTVSASTGTGSGELGLNLVDNDSIEDIANNKLGGAGNGNGNFTGQKYTIDRTGPAVEDIVRTVGYPDPTNASTVSWTVSFSESATGVDVTPSPTAGADFDLVATGTVAGAQITSVVPVDGATYTVTASTGTGSGTLRLDLDDDDTIEDQLGNKLGGVGTTGPGDGSFVGAFYTIDKLAPTAQSITRVGPTLTNAASVSWTVTFSEDVSDVEIEDFDLVPSGLTGSAITSVTPVSGPEDVYTVTATAGTGTGTLGLDLDDDDSITDALTNPLGGLGTSGDGDGSKIGEVFDIDTDKPSSAAGTVANITSATTFSVPYTANDNPNPATSLDKVELYVDGPAAGTNYVLEATDSTPSATGESFSYTGAATDGTYSFYTRAYDDAGNVEAAPGVADSTATKTTPPTFRMATGSYTGNAADNRTIAGLGFQPDVVIVKGAGQISVMRTSTMPSTGSNTKSLTDTTALAGSQVKALASDGFTLGTSAQVNGASTAYNWIAFKAAAGVLKVGTYNGSVAATQSITGAGFQPEYAAVLPANNTAALQRFAGMSEGFLFASGNGNATRITALGVDGFTVGAEGNANGIAYHYVLFNEIPGAIDTGVYTGDNSSSSQSITGVGFQPDHVMVRGDGNVNGIHRPASLSGTGSFLFTNAANVASGITALTASGFNVGNDSAVNANNNYYWLALKNTAGGSSLFSTLAGTLSRDSWVNQASTNENKGSDSVLKVTSKASGPSNTRGLVQFTLPVMPSGLTAKHSSMYLNNTSTSAAGRTIEAYRAAAAWTENGVTWGNQPATAGSSATATTASSSGFLEWTVSSLVSAMYSGSNFGFLLRDLTENDADTKEQTFSSKEAGGTLIPRLDVTFGN